MNSFRPARIYTRAFRRPIDPRVRAHMHLGFSARVYVYVCANTFYSRWESRATAHNYSYAIHQLVFMVKACVLAAGYVYMRAHTVKRRPRTRRKGWLGGW